MINRRDLFKAVPAVAIAAVTPTGVFADVPPSSTPVGETTMEVVRNYFRDNFYAVPYPHQLKDFDNIINLNQLIVNELPRIFNSTRQMPYGPTRGRYDPDRRTVVDSVYSRAYKAAYTLDEASSLRKFHGPEAEDVLMKSVAIEIATEILAEEHKLNLKGQYIKPYIPAIMVRAVDPNTFQPKICFKTRYAIGYL